MSLLDWPLEQDVLSRQSERRRKAVAVRIIRRFSEAFPHIIYDLMWESAFVNSQAWRQGSCQHVTVYGGLARHPRITASGLALMLAHETGHHLGGLPRDPDLRWPTWQGQADYWAASVGMPRVFGSTAGSLTLRGAKQIAALHGSFSEIDADVPVSVRLAIFKAGSIGENISELLGAAFKQMLDERE